MNTNKPPIITRPMILLKFGAYDDIVDLQKNGHLYCKPLDYFLTVEDDDLRGDPDENVLRYEYMIEGNITVQPIDDGVPLPLTFKYSNAQLKERVYNSLKNMFCLYSIRFTKETLGQVYNISKECARFGSHFLMIIDSDEFFKRLDTALEGKLIFKRGFVDYKDFSTYTGDRDLLHKSNNYSFQNEYRILIQNNVDDVLHINIGSIEDISTIYSSECIDHFRIKLGD